MDRGSTRRGFLGGAAAAGITAGSAAPGTAATRMRIPFHGRRQAGIATPRQRHITAAGFTVTATDRDGLRDLLRAWTSAAEVLTAGKRTGPRDSGETRGLPRSRLTITFGFGETLFSLDGADRFGLAARRPSGLTAVPALKGEALVPALSGGDIYVQACADDAQVAFHAIRALASVGRGAASLRWRQNGFRSDPNDGSTPRNLQGFKDGTRNFGPGDTTGLDKHVWVGGDTWMRGGTFLVMRRIRLLLEPWDSLSVSQQELAVGRHKASGAPLGLTREDAGLALGRLDAKGRRAIPLGAHVRHASAEENGGARILRRGFNYDDGLDATTGELDAGLFFLCFQRSPRDQAFRLLDQLATYDRLNEFSRHVASGVYACPPGVRRGSFIGAGLFPSG